MPDTPDRPEWLVPGAEVVAYTVGGVGYNCLPDARRVTVARVATQSFTIAGRTDRFKISTQERHTSGWHGYIERVVSIDSEEAQRELAKVQKQCLELEARKACEVWSKDRSRINCQAVIVAFQAIIDNKE